MNEEQKAIFKALSPELQEKFKAMLETQPEKKEDTEPKKKADNPDTEPEKKEDTEPKKKADNPDTEPEKKEELDIKIDLDLSAVIERKVQEKVEKQTLLNKIENNSFLLETVKELEEDWKNMPIESLSSVVKAVEQASRKLKPEPISPPTPKNLSENLVDFEDWYKKNMLGRRY